MAQRMVASRFAPHAFFGVDKRLRELGETLTDPAGPNPGAADWYVLIDGTELSAVGELIQSRFASVGAPVITKGTYRLLWDLAKGEL